LFSCALVLVGAESPGTNTLTSAWLSSRANVQTWSADVVQTRHFKSLSQPLKAQGRVWFSAPNQFRWELGTPPQTIALRQPDEMWVIYPRLKRAEKYPLNGDQQGPWRDTLALLEAGFPRNRDELASRFRILSEAAAGPLWELSLQPKSAAARRWMPLIKIAFATNDYSLRVTELQFADGSTMRNEFTNTVTNPQIPDSMFAAAVDQSFKVVEPLSSK
jgi:outer membrane lipoprotein-sorting protein